MNKKGMIKIVEAVIAIMIIAGAIIVSLGEKKTFEKPDLAAKARDILNEVANDANLRSAILTSPPPLSQSTPAPASVGTFINLRLPDYLQYEAILCDVDSVCGQSSYKGEVYSGERVISADTSIYAPIKIRLFIWEG